MSLVQGDAGVANERTALAWQRTALSLVAGAAVMARLTWADLCLVAALPLVTCVGFGSWVFWESRTRYRGDAGRRGRARDGRASGALAVAVMLLGVTEIAALAAVTRG